MNDRFEPLPIYIGVTGHRDIPPERLPSLTAEVERLLLSVHSRYPNCPVTVLSPLADGADRLCARVALATGCRLLVPLPMMLAEYEKDFDEASRRDFQELCGRAARVFTVPEDGPQPENAQRGLFYRRAGRYVAEHSHFLIALWDGRETLHPEGGGTFETILFAREQGREVCVVWTPRPDDTTAVPKLEELSILKDVCDDAARGEGKLPQYVREREPDFVDAETAKELSPGASRVLRTCLYADALSLRARDWKLLALRLLSLFGFLLVLSFLVYDEMESDLMLFVYAALIFAAFAVYFAASKKRLHEKYIKYRAIAEALRVQFYWGMCGIAEPACDSYSFTQREALGFCDAVLLSLWEDLESFGPMRPQKVKELWVHRQLDYHAASDGKKSKKDAFHRNAAKIMLALSLVLFALTAGMELFWKAALETPLPLGAARGLLLMHEGQIVWRGVLKIVLGTVSAATAFLANYYGGLALPQQIFDNRRMKALFASAMPADPLDEENFAISMHAVGREAMLECGGWYVAQRENEPGLFIG